MRKISLPISYQWMMLISPHSRKLLRLVQILRGWLPVVEVDLSEVDLPCICKLEKNADDAAILFRHRNEGSREIALRLRELSVLPPLKAIRSKHII